MESTQIKVAGSTSCNMASTICCWATAFASINNLDLTAILGSLSGKIPDNLCKTVLMTNVLKLEKHKLQKRLCGLRINSNKRTSFLVEKHEAEK
jgi:hypothetical protein